MLKINSCRQRNTSLKLRDGSDIVSAINDSHFISKVMSWLLAVQLFFVLSIISLVTLCGHILLAAPRWGLTSVIAVTILKLQLLLQLLFFFVFFSYSYS